MHFANEARPSASAETAEVVVLRGVGARSRHRSEGSPVLTPGLAAGLVAIVSIIPSELESFFRDEGCQSGEGVQWREPSAHTENWRAGCGARKRLQVRSPHPT